MNNRPLLIVKYQVDPAQEEAFCKWYEAYLERFMARVPEMVTGRRVVTEKNGIREYMSIYEIESPEKVDAAMAHIGQDTPERIKDSEEWHDWVENAMYYCTDAVWDQLQLIER